MACAYSLHLVAAVSARHRDRPLIDAFDLDSRKNAVVHKGGEAASVKGNWIRGSCCCLHWHSCWASGLQRVATVGQNEPPRVCRRPVGLSYAAMADRSSMA